MSYCREEGKDKIIFVTEEDHAESSKISLAEFEDEPEYEGLIKANGEINWECPCLGGIATGACGEQFKKAFSCFHHSQSEPKGSECIEQFRTMQECFSKYPDQYGEFENVDENNDKDLFNNGDEGTMEVKEQVDGSEETEVKEQVDGSEGTEVKEQVDGSERTEVKEQVDGSEGTEVKEQVDGSEGTEVKEQVDGSEGTEVKEQVDGSEGTEVKEQVDGSEGTEVKEQVDGSEGTEVKEQVEESGEEVTSKVNENKEVEEQKPK